jgi:hypothetical protein
MRNLWLKLLAKSIGFWHGLTILLAILVAAQVQYIQHGWINGDSVLYLEAAKFFSQGNWHEGFAVFPWPLYSLCIVAVHKITTLAIHPSAQLLNVLFFALATHGFVKLIRFAGGKQAQLIAGLLIWLSAQYMIGGVLEMLMRDEGFWAFYLLAIAAFIRFAQTQQLRHALCWQVMIIVATLFRVEGLFFLCLLPLFCVCQTQFSPAQRFKHWFFANSLNLMMVASVTLVFISQPQLSIQALGRLNEFLSLDIWSQFTLKLMSQSQVMANQVLGSYLDEFALPGLLLTFTYIIVVKTISTTGPIQLGLAWCGIKQRRSLMEPTAYQVLNLSAMIALLNAALIIVKVFVLSGRYITSLAMILMVYASFYLAKWLHENATAKMQPWRMTLLISVILLSLLGIFKNVWPKQTGYNFQQEAVAWVESQPNPKKVFYDDSRARFYAHQPFSGTWDSNQTVLEAAIRDQSILQYDYLFVTSNSKNVQSEDLVRSKLPQYMVVKRFFPAKQQKHIVIYKKKHN